MAKNEVRERLIDVGLASMLANGSNATGVKEIVEAANVPKGSFYYYFESKEGFTEAVVDRYAVCDRAMQAEIAKDVTLSPLRRLRRIFEAYLPVLEARGHTGGCLLGNLSLEVADHSDKVRAKLHEAFSAWQALLRDLLLEAEACGELRPGLAAGEAAEFLVNGWEGALVRMKADRSAKPLHLFLDLTFDHLLAASPPV